jgi:uncharacterized protein (UPF0335 family)
MTGLIAKEQLKQYIDRIERLENEKTDVLEAINEVFSEAKANGFDTKIMKKILKLMKQDKNKLAEEEAILELYKEALDL